MSKIKISLCILFSTISSQAVFCSNLSETIRLSDTVEETKKNLQKKVTSAKEHEDKMEKQKDLVKKAMRLKHVQSIDKSLREKVELLVKEINPDSAAPLRHLTGNDAASIDGTREKELFEIYKMNFKLERKARKLFGAYNSIEFIPQIQDPIDVIKRGGNGASEVTVKRVSTNSSASTATGNSGLFSALGSLFGK